MQVKAKETKKILVVEDCDDDYEVLAHILSKLNLPVTLHRCRNQKEVADTLFPKDSQRNASDSPDWNLILLDLKFPGGSGIDVLRQLRQSPTFPEIPVVVFTTSPDALDVQRAYHLGANSYLVKPMHFAKFTNLVELICSYWLDWNMVAHDFQGPGSSKNSIAYAGSKDGSPTC